VEDGLDRSGLQGLSGRLGTLDQEPLVLFPESALLEAGGLGDLLVLR
jgi:hypothetical protein